MRNLLIMMSIAMLSGCFVCKKAPSEKQIPAEDTMFAASGANASMEIKRITISEVANFDFNDSKLSKMNQISRVLNELRTNPGSRLIVVGHSDNLGTEEYNMKLSMQRAKAAAAAVRKTKQYDGEIEIIAKGSTDPIADNSTEEGRAENRRVDFVVVK